MSTFEKTYMAALKATAKDAREISGGRIKPHLRAATRSHALSTTRRKLVGADVPFSDLAKAVPTGPEPKISTEADELLLYLDNDEQTYRLTTSVQQSMAKKVRKGTYSHTMAPIGWLYVADRGAERYMVEIGRADVSPESRGMGKYAFSKPVREEVAAYLAWRFIKYAQGKEYDQESWA